MSDLFFFLFGFTKEPRCMKRRNIIKHCNTLFYKTKVKRLEEETNDMAKERKKKVSLSDSCPFHVT